MTEEENIKLQAVHLWTSSNKRTPSIKTDFEEIDAIVDYVMNREPKKSAKILARQGLGK